MNKEILEQELVELKSKLISLENSSQELRNNFKAIFPAKSCPVFLARDANAKSPFYWRYSSLNRKVLGKRIKNNFYKVIADLDKDSKFSILEFEINRIKLNYSLCTTKYQISRLEEFIANMRTWEINIRKLNKE